MGVFDLFKAKKKGPFDTLSSASIETVLNLGRTGAYEQAQKELSRLLDSGFVPPPPDPDAPQQGNSDPETYALLLISQNDSETWNAWRQKNNFENLYLPHINFGDLLKKEKTIDGKVYKYLHYFNFKNTDLEFSIVNKCYFYYIDFSNPPYSYWWLLNAEDSLFAYCRAVEGSFYASKFTKCRFLGCDLSSASFDYVHFNTVIFDDCKMPGFSSVFSNIGNTSISNCNLDSADFSRTAFTNMSFKRSDLKDCRFEKPIYKRRNLENAFVDVKNIDKITGDIVTVKDFKDQAFFDIARVDDRDRAYSLFIEEQSLKDKKAKTTAKSQKFALSFLGQAQQFFTNYLPPTGLVSGVVFGLIILLITYDFKIETLNPFVLVSILSVSVLGFALLSGKLGKQLSYLIWEQLDYGREWDRIILFSTLVIFLLGAGYHFLSPKDLCFNNLATFSPSHGACVADLSDTANASPLYPWYVAMMGFATLGIVDLVQPVTALGALFMSFNAFMGYAVLGLFLAVLQQSFLRRS